MLWYCYRIHRPPKVGRRRNKSKFYEILAKHTSIIKELKTKQLTGAGGSPLPQRDIHSCSVTKLFLLPRQPVNSNSLQLPVS